MTFKVTSKDSVTGQPVSGVLASVCVMETGQMFQRSSDGNGYSDLALESVPPVGKEVLLSVVKEGYQVYTQYFPITETDLEVSVALVPFVG